MRSWPSSERCRSRAGCPPGHPRSGRVAPRLEGSRGCHGHVRPAAPGSATRRALQGGTIVAQAGLRGSGRCGRQVEQIETGLVMLGGDRRPSPTGRPDHGPAVSPREERLSLLNESVSQARTSSSAGSAATRGRCTGRGRCSKGSRAKGRVDKEPRLTTVGEPEAIRVHDLAVATGARIESPRLAELLVRLPDAGLIPWSCSPTSTLLGTPAVIERSPSAIRPRSMASMASRGDSGWSNGQADHAAPRSGSRRPATPTLGESP